MKTDEKVNILMVDDQPAKLLSYEVILGDLGENLIKATSASEALNILLKTDVAVVLMDVSMPEFDGFELADMIRQHPRFQRTAIIFISGVHLTDTDKINGYRRGAVDYISVPVVPEVLRAKVGIFVELHRKTRLLEGLNLELERRVEERTEELRQSETQFRTLANTIPQLAWMANADGDVFWYNQRWQDFTGMDCEDLQQFGWIDVQHPDHRERVAAGHQKASEAGELWEDTFPLRGKDGDYRWFLARAVPIMDLQGKLVRWFGTATDITAQIAAEEKIRQLNRQLELRVTELETIMQVLPVGIAMSNDAQGTFVSGNAAFDQIFEMKEADAPVEVLQKSEIICSGKPVQASDLPLPRAALTGKPVGSTEMQVRLPSGRVKHVLASASPLYQASGAKGAVGAFFDVTDRKRMEDQLRERADLLELASDAIMVRSLDGTLQFWNSGAEHLYGWKRGEILGTDMHRVLKTVYSVAEEEVDRALAERKSWQGNLIHRTREGREIVVTSRMAVNREGNAVLEINRDITAQVQAEKALLQAEKLAAMGRVAGMIAHEINNPLEAITNAFYLLRTHPSLDDEARHYADLAEQELARASHITRQTLSFYRESNQPTVVAVSDLLDGILELQQRGLQIGKIALERQYFTPGLVRGMPVEFRQIFVNLISNAVQAMPDGGVLRICVSNATDWPTQRRGVVASIIDTGTGIRPRDAKRLFEPFFSTKAAKGTGLGLWISKGIAQKYEGRISFRSLPIGGRYATCFRVFLPSEGELSAGDSHSAAAQVDYERMEGNAKLARTSS
jgi:PAS domain S-box-containing protein